ncbi:MAG: type III pantothenate kinase [Cyanobacteria bacterium NC_groundwater_1444_Ag_S-0.65um_54_12]|nr:type III pantothenate kinase [Cyanobacteria bacterium NC_groundwater_1444_Ag_S-0.65um_54_12]
MDKLCVIVVGNSRTTMTSFVNGEIGRSAGWLTSDIVTGNVHELACWVGKPDETVVVSVVPRAEVVIRSAFPAAIPLQLALAPIRVHYQPASALGLDRVANALAARELFGSPCLIIDCGTATTLTMLNAEGELAGGAIAIGLGTARDALAQRTAQLPTVELAVPQASIATDTRTALQIGLVRGQAGLIRQLASELAPGKRWVLTGGWSTLLAPLLPECLYCEHLTPWGGKVYWEGLRQ